MPRIKQVLHRVALRAEETFDALRYRGRRRLGRIGPLRIVAYLGHGTRRDLYLKGRVLEERKIRPAHARDSAWQNVRMMIRRFRSNEIPGAHVHVHHDAAAAEVVTDHEGYFQAHLRPAVPLPTDRMWHRVQLRLAGPTAERYGAVTSVGQVQVPSGDAAFGVISDIDDTVLQTGAMSFWQMAQVTMLHNAHTRLPFDGVAAFYRALQQGPERQACNPVFYVSSSPWNLYDLLVDFFEIQNLPAGTLFLRDLGLETGQFIKSSHGAHKLLQIERILSTYPDLPFILIGDSGQKDPEIYLQAVQAHPGRIRAVYIRDVAGGLRARRVNEIAEEVRRHGPDLVLAEDTAAAARHAARKGYIAPDALPGVLTRRVRNPRPMAEVAEGGR